MEKALMQTPEFFGRMPRITVRDPLGEFLGAAAGGVMEYSYLDAVKLAGHSCPTVAGAWLATVAALRCLYPDTLPERGGIRVELRGALEDGTVGVVANVAGLITGAAGSGGFKGIAGRFGRKDLLVLGAPIRAALRFTRLDTGACVETDLPGAEPLSPQGREALTRALHPDATPAERLAFSRAWQARVERMCDS
jgi:hypothetical protein